MSLKKLKKKTLKSKLAQQKKLKNSGRKLDFSRDFDLANFHFKQGNFAEAERIYSHILSGNPQDPMALYGLGLIAGVLGNLERAVYLTQKSISINPRDPVAYDNLGIYFAKQNKLEDAINCFQKAIALKDDYASAHFHLGNAFKEKGSYDNALKCYRKTIILQPKNAGAYLSIGDIYMMERHDYDKATKNYQRAIDINPHFAEAYYALGFLFKAQGKLHESEKLLQKALSIQPAFAEAHRSLSRIHKYTEHNEHIKEMERLVSMPGLPDHQRMHLCFALGKAYEDLEAYDRSFAFLHEGNSLKRKTYNYSIENSSRLIDSLKSTFNQPPGITEKPQNPTPTPIFILGMPRSGTSLVEQILATHSRVHGAGELTDFAVQLYRITGTEKLEDACVTLLQKGHETFTALGKEYLKKIKQYNPDAHYITDKMPGNFMCIGAIRHAIPTAKIIHCTRNPMDNCFSIYKNYFALEHKYAYDLNELGQYYLLYQNLMQFWKEQYPDFIHEVNYEKIISEQEKQTRVLLDFCGLEWEDQCLTYYNTDRNVTTLSAEQVRQPMYTSSIFSWKKYEKYLKPLNDIIDT